MNFLDIILKSEKVFLKYLKLIIVKGLLIEERELISLILLSFLIFLFQKKIIKT